MGGIFILLAKYKKILLIAPIVLILLIANIGIRICIDSNGMYSKNGIETKRKIGATYMTMNNPFYEIVDEEIRYVVEGQGDILISRDPALSLEKQIEQIYDFIDLGVEAIFVNPVEWKGIEPALWGAKEKGIKIITIDTSIYDNDLVSCSIISDNYYAGVKCAEDLMSRIDSAEIILLEHSTAKSAIDRIQGFEDTLEGHSNYKIIARKECEGQLELAMPAVEELINNGVKADVIMALNDPSALGAIMALESKGVKNVMVYGVDGSPDGKSMVDDGKMTATVAQFPREIGKTSSKILYKLLSGEEVKKEIIIPVELINSNNVNQYDITIWDK